MTQYQGYEARTYLSQAQARSCQSGLTGTHCTQGQDESRSRVLGPCRSEETVTEPGSSIIEDPVRKMTLTALQQLSLQERRAETDKSLLKSMTRAMNWLGDQGSLALEHRLLPSAERQHLLRRPLSSGPSLGFILRPLTQEVDNVAQGSPRGRSHSPHNVGVRPWGLGEGLLLLQEGPSLCYWDGVL